MQIKPLIMKNVHIAAHPEGIRKSVNDRIDWVKAQEKIEMTGKNVLIVGGSSGYGFGTRLSLAFAGGANTINVSFESAPEGKRTGTAGWWNNIFFQQAAKAAGLEAKDFIGDAFSWDTKQLVADYIKDTYGTIDMLVYSLASGVRPNPDTKELVRSALKPIGKSVNGKTIDIARGRINELSIDGASEEEIKDTVYVMGGDDWKMWVNFLKEKNLLAEGFKTISYTYIGAESMSDIYRAGTIGKAKEDLEATAKQLDKELFDDLNGEAMISVSKAVATKASVFIPGMPVYGCILFDEMIKFGNHETVLEHKYRLYKDMIFGEKRDLDENGRLRLDATEMEESIQSACLVNIPKYENDYDALMQLAGSKVFIDDFYKMNGFKIDGVDYDAEVNMEELSKLKPE